MLSLMRKPPFRHRAVVITDFDRKPFMDAMSEIYDKSLSDPKLRQLVDRIRKVE